MQNTAFSLNHLLDPNTQLTYPMVKPLTSAEKTLLIQSLLEHPEFFHLRVRTEEVLHALLMQLPEQQRLAVLTLLLNSPECLRRVVPNAASLAKFCQAYPVMIQTVKDMLLTCEVFRARYLVAFYCFNDLSIIPVLRDAIQDWFLEDPERLLSSKPTILPLTWLKSKQVSRLSEIITLFLNSPRCLQQLLSKPRNLLSFVDAFPQHHAALMTKVMEDEAFFHNVFPTAADMVAYTEKYPDYAKPVAAWVIESPARFGALITTMVDLQCFTAAFPEYRQFLAEQLFAHPGFFTTIFRHCESVLDFSFNFPELKNALLQRIQSEPDVLRKVFSDTLAFLAILEHYPDQQAEIIQKILEDDVAKHRVIGVAFDVYRIVMRLDRQVANHFINTLMQDDLLVMKVLKSDLHTQTLLKEAPAYEQKILRLFAMRIVAEPTIADESWRLDRLSKMSPLFGKVFRVSKHAQIVPAATGYLEKISRNEICKNVFTLFSGRGLKGSSQFGLSDDLILKIATSTRISDVHTERQAQEIGEQQLRFLATLISRR